MEKNIIVAMVFIIAITAGVANISAATGNKGGFAVGGFSVAAIGDSVMSFMGGVKAQLVDSIAKAAGVGDYVGMYNFVVNEISADDLSAIMEAIENGDPINVTIELPNRVVKFKAGSDLAKTVR